MCLSACKSKYNLINLKIYALPCVVFYVIDDGCGLHYQDIYGK